MFNYTLNFIPNRFFVFGCGGTGSRLVPLVAQYIKSCDWLKAFNPQMYLVDFDTVETKNLARQNFISKDVGSNKAEVLARRYSAAYDLPITAIPFKLRSYSEARTKKADFESYDAFTSLLRLDSDKGFSDSIVFICVDSIQARQDIVKLVLEDVTRSPNTIIIDTGNENDFGQVKLSGVTTPLCAISPVIAGKVENLPDVIPVQGKMSHLPFDISYFKDMQPPVVKASCADLEQTMAINSMIANTAFSVLQTLLSMLPITAHRYNVSVAHGTSVEYYTVKTMMELGKYGSPYCKSHGYLTPNISNDDVLTPGRLLDLLVREVETKFPAMMKNYIPPVSIEPKTETQEGKKTRKRPTVITPVGLDGAA